MALQDVQADGRLFPRRQVNQSYDSAMRMTVLDRQRAKIFIEGYQCATFPMSVGQDRLISRIALPVARPNDIMPGIH